MKTVKNIIFITISLILLSCASSEPPQTVTQTRPIVQQTHVQENTGSLSSLKDPLDAAVREASLYFDLNIPRGSKVAIINIDSDSDVLSDYIIDELIADLLKDKYFTVVDRKQLTSIKDEQRFQLSGEVDDQTATEIGKFLGAQTIISGSLIDIGNKYRLSLRALNVTTAQVQGQFNTNIESSTALTTMMNRGKKTTTQTTRPAVTPSGHVTQTPAIPTPIVSPPPTQPTEPQIQGIMAQGNTLTAKIEWLQRNADSHNTYILEVTADESIAPTTFSYSGTINITIVLRGDSQNRTIRLRSHGEMFTVKANVTFILSNNITLQGHSGNTGALIYVYGGNFKMQSGSHITGNSKVGVHSSYGSIFEMYGGTISGNEGGGAYIEGGEFTMRGGSIYRNTANKGGGVYCRYGKFTMLGGTISNNIATEYGGGVCIEYYSTTFLKSGGIITGNDNENSNVVVDKVGNVLARRGHAIYRSDDQRKETTAGQNAHFDTTKNTGAWN